MHNVKAFSSHQTGNCWQKNYYIIKNISNYLIIMIMNLVVSLHLMCFALFFAGDTLWYQNVQPAIITTKCKRITSCIVVYLMMMNIVIAQKYSYTHIWTRFDCVHLWRLWRVSFSVIAIDPWLLLLLHEKLFLAVIISFNFVLSHRIFHHWRYFYELISNFLNDIEQRFTKQLILVCT